MPRKKNSKRKANTAQKIKCRLMGISLKVDDYIYKKIPLTPEIAQQYLKKMTSLEPKCRKDPHSLQVIEKLTRLIKLIIEEQSTNSSTVHDINSPCAYTSQKHTDAFLDSQKCQDIYENRVLKCKNETEKFYLIDEEHEKENCNQNNDEIDLDRTLSDLSLSIINPAGKEVSPILDNMSSFQIVPIIKSSVKYSAHTNLVTSRNTSTDDIVTKNNAKKVSFTHDKINSDIKINSILQGNNKFTTRLKETTDSINNYPAMSQDLLQYYKPAEELQKDVNEFNTKLNNMVKYDSNCYIDTNNKSIKNSKDTTASSAYQYDYPDMSQNILYNYKQNEHIETTEFANSKINFEINKKLNNSTLPNNKWFEYAKETVNSSNNSYTEMFNDNTRISKYNNTEEFQMNEFNSSNTINIRPLGDCQNISYTNVNSTVCKINEALIEKNRKKDQNNNIAKSKDTLDFDAITKPILKNKRPYNTRTNTHVDIPKNIKTTNLGKRTYKSKKKKNINDDLSWVESIKYVREVEAEEFDQNINNLDESFWTNYNLPIDWNEDYLGF